MFILTPEDSGGESATYREAYYDGPSQTQFPYSVSVGNNAINPLNNRSKTTRPGLARRG